MRVGIVNEQPAAVAALRSVLACRPQHEIAWVAPSGALAIDLCVRKPPDLVLLDLALPDIDGVEATRRIMAASPCAVLIVTAVTGEHTGALFEAMGHGALDAVDTPAPGDAAAFLRKIDLLDRLIASRRFVPAPQSSSDTWVSASRERLIAIGASAGGPVALTQLLSRLPAGFPAAVVLVQHVDARFAPGMAEWLSRNCSLPVRVVREGDRPTAGTVLLAGTDDHLILKSHNRLGYTAEPKDLAYRPSVDVFFESINAHWPGTAIGVLLTGMGRDGARGLKAMRGKGYYTIAQDEASSAVFGMPKAAAALGAAVDVLSLDEIAARLIDVCIT